MILIPFFLFGGFIALVCNVDASPRNPKAELPKPPSPNSRVQLDSNPPACDTVDTFQVFNAIKDKRYRWTGFYVQPDVKNTDDEKKIINDAMYYLMKALPCVKFGIYRATDKPRGDFAKIYRDAGGCSSPVGKQGGTQYISLGNGCWSVGTVTHEMIHALGMHHEQCRPDRDDYVDIHYENIPEDKRHNFDKLTWSEYDTYGVAYNVKSIMHYWGTAFGIDGKTTISSKTGETVGTQGVLQDTDIDKLQKMYNCSSSS